MNTVQVMDGMCKGMRAVGIPRDIERQLEHCVSTWLSSSGSNWTLDRVKDLVEYRINLEISPDTTTPPEGFRRTRKKRLAGPFRIIENMRLKTALDSLSSITTSFVEDEVTKRQWDKWYHGVTSFHDGTPTSVIAEMVSTLKALGVEPALQQLDQLEVTLPDLSCMTATAYPLSDGSTQRRPSGLETGDVDATRALARMYVQQWEDIPNCALEYLADAGLYSYRDIDFSVSYSDHIETESFYGNSSVIGNIGFLQQEKSKLRSVANPNRILQDLLVPLQKALQSVTSQWTFTTRQIDAIKGLQSDLQKGSTVYSFDMSAATDTLDFDAQLSILQKLAPENGQAERILDLFGYASKGLWNVPNTDFSHENQIQFVTGQPLGLAPSFPTLDLFNVGMATCALRRVYAATTDLETRKKVSMTQIYVVGDDCAISNHDPYISRRVAEEYSSIVSSFGSEINLEKALVSDKMAEFCGHLITDRSYFLKQNKLKQVTDQNALSVISQWNAPFFAETPLQKKAVYSVRKIPSLYGKIYGASNDTSVDLSTSVQVFEALKATDNKELWQGEIEVKDKRSLSNLLLASLSLQTFEGGIEICVEPKALDQLTIPDMSRVDTILPTKTTYNHRTARQEIVESNPLYSAIKVGRKYNSLLERFPKQEVVLSREPYPGFKETNPGVKFEFIKSDRPGQVLVALTHGENHWDTELPIYPTDPQVIAHLWGAIARKYTIDRPEMTNEYEQLSLARIIPEHIVIVKDDIKREVVASELRRKDGRQVSMFINSQEQYNTFSDAVLSDVPTIVGSKPLPQKSKTSSEPSMDFEM